MGVSGVLALAGCGERPGGGSGEEVRAAAQALETDPDLVISAVRGPASVMPWGELGPSVMVCNEGESPSYGVGVALYLSDDPDFTSTDPLAGNGWVPGLEPGECAELSVPAWAQGAGVFHLGAIVDPFEQLVEADDTNNAGSGGLIGVGWGSDLVVSAVSGPPSSIPGGDFDVAVTVCNQGTEASYGANAEVWLSADDEIGATDQPLGAAWFGYLDAGACVEVTVPAGAYVSEGVWYLGAIADAQDDEVELIETNNATAGEQIGVGWGPDLVISGVSGPPSLMLGSYFTVSATVCNQGTVSSYGGPVEARLSADDEIDDLDELLGTAWLNDLGPGECAEVEIGASSSAPEGVYRVGAVASSGGAVELIDSNNTRAGNPIGIGWKPDLVVSAVSAPPSVVPGGSFDAAVTVCNQGTVSAYGTEIVVHLSDDDSITGADELAGVGWVGYLDAGQCADAVVPSYANVVPQGPYPAEPVYRVGAIVDRYDGNDELIESNNAAAGGQIGVGWGSDLVVSSVSGPPSTTPGAPFEVTAVVCNQGTEPSFGANLELRLSQDATISQGDLLISGAPVPSLDVGQCEPVVLQASAYVPDGVYRAGAIVSGQDELNTSNNTAASDLFGVGWAPDLVVSAVSGPPSAIPGGSFTVSAIVCNQGTNSAYGVQVKAQLSTDDQITAHDELLGSGWVSYLDPGQCAAAEVQASAWAPLGVYRVGATASADAYGELVQSNNSRAGNLMGIGWYPDLIVSAVSAPPSVVPGGSFEAAVTVCNQGTIGASSSMLEVRLSTDAGISSSDSLVGMSQTGHVDAGQCVEVVVPSNAYVDPPGPSSSESVYHVGAIVDPPYGYTPHGDTEELIESNNTAAGALIGVGWGPDLVVSSVSGPSSVTPGALFDVTAVVCNQGTQQSGSARLDLRLSSDAAITEGDPFAGSAPVPFLDVGQCAPVAVQAQAYVPDGVYQPGAIVTGSQELITSNNAAAGELFGVGWGADLVITAVDAPPSAAPGSFDASVTVCNQGTTSSGGAQVELFFSTGALLTPSDPPLGAGFSGPLAPGECAHVDVPASTFGPQGVRRLVAIVDRWGNAPELIESNNTTTGDALTIAD